MTPLRSSGDVYGVLPGESANVKGQNLPENDKSNCGKVRVKAFSQPEFRMQKKI